MYITSIPNRKSPPAILLREGYRENGKVKKLLTWRGEIVRRGLLPWRKWLEMKAVSWVLRNRRRYQWSGKLARWAVRWMLRWMLYNRLNDWAKSRELPEFPRKSFRELYRNRNGRNQ